MDKRVRPSLKLYLVKVKFRYDVNRPSLSIYSQSK